MKLKKLKIITKQQDKKLSQLKQEFPKYHSLQEKYKDNEDHVALLGEKYDKLDFVLSNLQCRKSFQPKIKSKPTSRRCSPFAKLSDLNK